MAMRRLITNEKLEKQCNDLLTKVYAPHEPDFVSALCGLSKQTAKWILGGIKCARGRALVGVIRRTKGDKRFAQHSILPKVHSREEISQVRIIILFLN